MAGVRTHTDLLETQFNDEGNRSSLNFKVTLEFKGYAYSQGITMIDFLKESFALSKKLH